MRRSILAMLVILIMVFSVTIPLQGVIADDDEPPPHKDPPEKKPEEGPTVTPYLGDDYVKISSHLRDKHEDTIDDIDLKLSVRDGVAISLTSEHKDDQIETNIFMDIELKYIIGYDDDGDKLAKLRFKDIEFYGPEYYPYWNEGKYVYKVYLNSKDGRFTIKALMSGDFEDGDDGAKVPEPINIEIKMKHFEFEEVEEEIAEVALVIVMRSNTRTLIKDSDDDVEAEVMDRDHDPELGDAYLKFDRKAEVDGYDKNAFVAVEEDRDGNTEVKMVYPEAEKIHHNLELGIVPNALVLKGDIVTYGLSLVAVGALFALTSPTVLARVRKP